MNSTTFDFTKVFIKAFGVYGIGSRKVKKNDTIDCWRLLSTTCNLVPRTLFPDFGGGAKPTSKATEKRPGDEVKQHRLCEHSLRSSRLKVFGRRKEQARERETRASGEKHVSPSRAPFSL